MKLVHVLGTRPNFVKMAPVIGAVRERMPETESIVVHTGQHYDEAMSQIFFEELGVPEPDHMLGVGSVRFVDAIVGPAEEMGHHPDLSISWDEVAVSITNHAAGGLTANDFELATRIDALD